MKLNKNSGFTLLEIIIVIIIIGVLASLALPKFFSTVEYSRSAEALANLGATSHAIDRCLIKNGSEDTRSCRTWAELDIDDPSNGGTEGLFTYAFGAGAADGSQVITATRPSGAVIFTRATTAAGGRWKASGTSAFSAI